MIICLVLCGLPNCMMKKIWLHFIQILVAQLDSFRGSFKYLNWLRVYFRLKFIAKSADFECPNDSGKAKQRLTKGLNYHIDIQHFSSRQ